MHGWMNVRWCCWMALVLRSVGTSSGGGGQDDNCHNIDFTEQCQVVHRAARLQRWPSKVPGH